MNNVIIIYMGSNFNTLTIANDIGIANGLCTVGPPASPFGQYAYCNAEAFWVAVVNLCAAGKLVVPPPGIAADGLPCPLLRNFFIIDMDPSDGVITTYLVIKQGRVM